MLRCALAAALAVSCNAFAPATPALQLSKVATTRVEAPAMMAKVTPKKAAKAAKKAAPKKAAPKKPVAKKAAPKKAAPVAKKAPPKKAAPPKRSQIKKSGKTTADFKAGREFSGRGASFSLQKMFGFKMSKESQGRPKQSR